MWFENPREGMAVLPQSSYFFPWGQGTGKVPNPGILDPGCTWESLGEFYIVLMKQKRELKVKSPTGPTQSESVGLGLWWSLIVQAGLRANRTRHSRHMERWHCWSPWSMFWPELELIIIKVKGGGAHSKIGKLGCLAGLLRLLNLELWV